jgi:hypothetical protein
VERFEVVTFCKACDVEETDEGVRAGTDVSFFAEAVVVGCGVVDAEEVLDWALVGDLITTPTKVSLGVGFFGCISSGAQNLQAQSNELEALSSVK